MRALTTKIIAAVIAATALAATSAAAVAAPAEVQSACLSGRVCLWVGEEYQGYRWSWSPADGYRALPAELIDKVGSFVAEVDACFVDTGKPDKKVKATAGSHRKYYKSNGNFGARMNAIGPVSHCG